MYLKNCLKYDNQILDVTKIKIIILKVNWII